jgi:hypothetical protein
MQLIVDSDGTIRCIYNESLDLARIVRVRIRRASHVEPDAAGRWHADLSPVHGPTLGPFLHRSEAPAAEQCWLEQHRLLAPDRAASAAHARCRHDGRARSDRRRDFNGRDRPRIDATRPEQVPRHGSESSLAAD